MDYWEVRTLAKQYLIPHNYANNGRVFNMFHKKDLVKALIWFIPISVLIFKLPIQFNTKLFWEIIVAFPPAMAILAGYACWIGYILQFSKNRRIYISVRKGDHSVLVYQKFKGKASNQE